MSESFGRVRAVSALGLCVLLSVSACGSGSDGETKENAACPPVQKPTGVTSGTMVDPDSDDDILKVVDSGFLQGERGVSHVLSYGIVMENTSDKVLYDASVSVRFVDEDGKNVFEVFENVADVDQYGWGQLKDIPVPVVMPGEQVGFGDRATLWTEYFSDGSGNVVEPDPPDYDEVSIEVSLNSGEWWPIENDVHKFLDVEIGDVNLASTRLKAGDEGIKYPDGRELSEYKPKHEVEFSACKEAEFYTDTSVLYDTDGNIVGGGRYRGGYMRSFEPGTTKDTWLSPSWGPEGELTAKVFEYAQPLSVNLAE